MIRLLILALVVAAVGLALWLMWRGASATDPFAGVADATLRAQAREAAATAVRVRPLEPPPSTPTPSAPSPGTDPVIGEGTPMETLDEARLREQTRERALAEAQRRTPATTPEPSGSRPWFVPVARSEPLPLDASPTSAEPVTGEHGAPVSPGPPSLKPAWQRR